MKKIVLTTVLIIFLFACQKTETLNHVVFDNSLLNKFSFNSAEKKIILSYKSSLEDPFVEHVMLVSPVSRVASWLEDNIINFGTMNRIVIDVQNASIIRSEIITETKVKGVLKKQDEYLYELNLLVVFNFFNDDSRLLATSKAEILRSTTSSRFISLNKRDNILDILTFETLKDLSDKSSELLQIHMSEFIL